MLVSPDRMGAVASSFDSSGQSFIDLIIDLIHFRGRFNNYQQAVLKFHFLNMKANPSWETLKKKILSIPSLKD